MMKKNNLMEAISFPKRIFLLTGHWPETSPSIFQRMLLVMDTLLVVSLLMEIANHLDDYGALFEHMSTAISTSSYLIKALLFKFKSYHVHELLNLLKLKEFNDLPRDLRSIIDNKVNFSKFLGILYLSMCFVTILLISLLPIFTQRDLPVELSYDVGQFKPAIYAFQVLGLANAAANNTSLDILAIILMGVCSAQIEILNRKIIELGSCNQSGEDTSRYINDGLRKCVIHHVKIIGYHKILEEVFYLIVLTQYATSAAVICNIGFQLVHTQVGSFEFIYMIFYFISMMIQLMIYCWFGNEIILKSSAITDACYELKWFESDHQAKKALFIIMERCRRPLCLTAGKISILSLQSFGSVIKTSYSYFALMQTLYRENLD